jgi:uncharacterized protein
VTTLEGETVDAPSGRESAVRRRLVAVGKVLLFVLITAVATAASYGVAALLSRSSTPHDWVGYLMQVAGLLVATWVMLRWVDRRGWHTVGLGREAARPRLLAEGWVLGMLAIALPSLLLAAVGWMRFRQAADGSWWGAALAGTAMLAPAALLEELMMRGYAFDVLRRVWGPAATLALTSVVFGLLHTMNPGATALSIALVTLAGFFLGGVVLVTGSVWAAWAAHLAWNWTMAVLLHTAVSGLPLATPDYVLADAGPDWATGGPWGPEGGAGGALGMIGGVGYLIARRRRRWEIPER